MAYSIAMKREPLVHFLTHAFAALLLFFLPALTLPDFCRVPTLLRTPAGAAALSAFSLAYIACVCVLMWRAQRAGKPLFYEIVAATGSFLFLILITLLVIDKSALDPDLPRRWVFSGVLLFVVFAAALIWWRTLPRVKLVGLVLATLMSVALIVRAAERLRAPPSPMMGEYFVNTSLYNVKVTRYKHWYPYPFASGGAMSAFAGRKLLVTGDGDMYYFEQTPDRRGLSIEKLALRVPLNATEFRQDVSAGINPTYFRVGDILVTQDAGLLRLYASHHYWNHEDRCTVVRVSVIAGAEAQFSQPRSELVWNTIYETPQCLPLDMERGEMFAGLQMGGRMALSRDGRLLLSLGDHEFDGWNRPAAVSPDPASPYGKIIAIRLDDLTATTYCSGLRNPQGLLVDPEGAIWATDHGPEGGDELNRILEGRDYGWPRVTYGAEYGLRYWPPSQQQGSHAGYERPIFAWVPSPAVSDLVRVDGERFPLWRGDFLIGTLKAKSLLRVRVREGRALLVEQPIFINGRFRDMMMDESGRLIVWADGDLLFIDAADVDPAAAVFDRCAGCHSVDAAGQDGAGPNLRGIVGRRVASRKGFNYSPALRSLGGTWTEARLDRFIANPGIMVPGTTMQVEGISDAEARRKLIDYLETLQ